MQFELMYNRNCIFQIKKYKCHVQIYVEHSMMNLSKQDQVTKNSFLTLGSVFRKNNHFSY